MRNPSRAMHRRASPLLAEHRPATHVLASPRSYFAFNRTGTQIGTLFSLASHLATVRWLTSRIFAAFDSESPRRLRSFFSSGPVMFSTPSNMRSMAENTKHLAKSSSDFSSKETMPCLARQCRARARHTRPGLALPDPATFKIFLPIPASLPCLALPHLARPNLAVPGRALAGRAMPC